jgi:hypothetical protein
MSEMQDRCTFHEVNADNFTESHLLGRSSRVPRYTRKFRNKLTNTDTENIINIPCISGTWVADSAYQTTT